MLMIHIEDNGKIYCGKDVQSMIVCDFFGTYKVFQECGNCPLARFMDKFIELEFNVDRSLFLSFCE